MLDRRPQSEEFPKDVHGVWMTPGERPRQAFPFPSSTDCPKCGSRGWAENTGETFHCYCCGTWLFRDPPVPWSRYNNKTLCRQYKRSRTVICCEPGCGAEFRTTSLHKSVRCIKCRDRIRKQNNARYRKEAREKLKLAVASDDGRQGGVKTVVAVNVTEKEA